MEVNASDLSIKVCNQSLEKLFLHDSQIILIVCTRIWCGGFIRYDTIVQRVLKAEGFQLTVYHVKCPENIMKYKHTTKNKAWWQCNAWIQWSLKFHIIFNFNILNTINSLSRAEMTVASAAIQTRPCNSRHYNAARHQALHPVRLSRDCDFLVTGKP